MAGGILSILIFLSFFTILQVVVQIIRQQKHLEDETLRKIVDTTIKDEDNYDAAIAHLGICEKCQKRLEEISLE